MNFQEFLSGKSNRLLMVCGRSGTGKSELMKVFLLSVVKAPKIVFSFKPNDTHLSLPVSGRRRLEGAYPNPFQNADDFSTAYALAFPANLRGASCSPRPGRPSRTSPGRARTGTSSRRISRQMES